MFKITQPMVDEYSKAYPALNIMTEIKKMNLWFQSHPSNKKKNIKKFVNGWLSRAQDKAPSKKITAEDAQARIARLFGNQEAHS